VLFDNLQNGISREGREGSRIMSTPPAPSRSGRGMLPHGQGVVRSRAIRLTKASGNWSANIGEWRRIAL